MTDRDHRLKQMYIKLYQTLYKDLRSLAAVADVSEEDLQKYFDPKKEHDTNILCRLCSSLQISGMMHNSIRFNDEKNHKIIKEVMCGFDAEKAAKKYKSREAIYNSMINSGICDNGIRDKRETNWEKYCHGLYDGLEFLIHEKGEAKIKGLVSAKILDDTKIKDIRNIAKRIHGLGFALTCDWLKECGCLWLAKPDVHIKYVIQHLKESEKPVKDEEVLEELFIWAECVKESGVDPDATAYKLDKIIWLLCTGNFYNDHKQIGREAICQKMDATKKNPVATPSSVS